MGDVAKATPKKGGRSRDVVRGKGYKCNTKKGAARRDIVRGKGVRTRHYGLRGKFQKFHTKKGAGGVTVGGCNS